MITALQPAKLQIRAFNYRLKDTHPPCFIAPKPAAESYGIEVEAQIQHLPVEERPDRKPPKHLFLLVVLTLSLSESPERVNPNNRFDNLSMSTEFLFHIPSNVPAGFVNDELLVNCLNISYSTMRGQMHLMTSGVNGPPVVLPGVTMQEVYDRLKESGYPIKRILDGVKALLVQRRQRLPQGGDSKSLASRSTLED